MKKYLILIIAVLFIVLPIFSQEEHQKIVEEVSVNWWVVPIFAVDNDGRPVRFLKPEDIEITLNDRIMPKFNLYKRTFSRTERTQQTVQLPAAQQVPIDKKKVIFLLFDQALSTYTSTIRAKEIAKKIIMDAEPETHFFIMVIDPFAGLVNVGEGSGKNKGELITLVKKEVVEKPKRRVANAAEMMRQMGGGGQAAQNRYEEDDYGLFQEAAAKPFKRESMGFFYAFETLYFYLNAIEDNKFVYLFSEGMSKSILESNRSIGGARGMYQYYIKKVADFLNRCGAIFFLINTMGVDQHTSTATTAYQQGGDVLDSFSAFSGEESLQFLAKKSGGTYLEGAPEEIVEKIENMHLSYYEISFPDPPQLEKNITRDIIIKTKQKGIKIYTMRSLERRKHYSQMKPVEKDMLVLNLVTQPPNVLIKSKINAYSARVDKTKESKKEVAYMVTLPSSYLRQNLDLYKVWLTVNDQGLGQLQKVEKESLYPQNDKLNIQFQLIEDKKRKKDKDDITGETKTYFVLINGTAEPARASVHGFELYDEDPELPVIEKPIITKIQKGKKVNDEEINKILQGAADYCDRLKKSAFHFYCQEKIVETRHPLTSAENTDPHIDEESMRKYANTALDQIRTKAYTHVNAFLFGYRLLKQGDKINEVRDYISSKDNVKVNRDQVIKTNAFFSEKSIFAPITLLDRSRQEKYNFKFIGIDDRHGRQAAVLEATPKNPVETATIYGNIWIDTEDFSVMKIEADPKSISSYDLLKNLARKLRTRLHLTLEIDFDQLHNGIRFPTKVSMLEKYQGGRIIQEHRGYKGWERTRAEFTYTDYQFFSVQTEVTVQ